MPRSASPRRFFALVFSVLFFPHPAVVAAENPVGRLFEEIGRSLTPEAPRKRPARRSQRRHQASLPASAPLPPERPQAAQAEAAPSEPDKNAEKATPAAPQHAEAQHMVDVPLPTGRPAGLGETQPAPASASPAPVPAQERLPAPERTAATPLARIVGSGGCGVTEPFKLEAVGPDKRLVLSPPATLNRAMLEILVRFEDELQTLAQKHFNEPLARIGVAASYVCRPINSVKTARLSEHAKGNAVDIGSFTLKSGRGISVERDWRSEGAAKAFLQEVRASACRHFVVVLTPDGDAMHQNHMHLDLGRSRICH